MNILFKILLATVSTIFCIALVYTICRVWKRRISYYGSRNIACQDEPHNKKLRKVQDEMFEEFGRNESKMEQEETVVLTKELIKAARTTNGGLTKKQLAAIGVPWPPPKGWQESKIGTMITEEQLKRFQTIEYATKKKRKRKLHSTLP